VSAHQGGRHLNDTPFDVVVDAFCNKSNVFWPFRRRLGSHPPAEWDRAALRTAAREFRDAGDRLAEMPEWTEEGQPTGATIDAKAHLIGGLIIDAVALHEPWLVELGTRMATRAVAAHSDDFDVPERETTPPTPADLPQDLETPS